MATGTRRTGATVNSDEKKSSTVSSPLPHRENKRTDTKRKLRTSPHFAHVIVAPPRNSTPAGVNRSKYFVSSPDSPAGSAVSFDWGSAFTQSAVDAFRACPEFEYSGVRHLCRRLCYLRAYEVRRGIARTENRAFWRQVQVCCCSSSINHVLLRLIFEAP